MSSYAFGVDMGGTTIKFGLFQADGTLLEKWNIPTRTHNHGENILTDIALSLLYKMAEKSISVSEVLGVGMGVPGAVVGDNYVKPCVNLDGWGDFNVPEKLAALCHLPTRIVNDANAATLGEMSNGGGKGYKNMVFVTLGTGVGGGIIVDGKLVRGVHGAGGEFGHMKVKNYEEQVCGCGKRGCLEQYSSATGVVNTAKKMLKDNSLETKLTDFDPMTCKDIFDCAKDGDVVANQVVDECMRLLGKALAAVSTVVDPDIFVIGGGVAKAGDIIINRTQKYFRSYAFPATEDTKFALAQLGNDAGIYGAVQMILGDV